MEKSMDPPVALLRMIGFDLMTSDEILNSSIFDIHEKVQGSKSLCDPRLGLPNSENKCSTCQSINIKEHQCPGHFGHISLSWPIFNPEHICILVRVLNAICPNCGKRKVKERKGEQTSIAPHCQEGLLEVEDCKYCNNLADVQYPEVKFTIVTKKLQDIDVMDIEMQVVRSKGTQFPSDFWSFLDRSKDFSESPRLVRPLLPVEAIKILQSIPEDVYRRIGIALRPACLIIKNFCIPPNCLRSMDSYKLGHCLRRLERNQKTRALSSIVSRSKSLKRSYNDLYSARKDAMELQSTFANYYKSFKIFSSEKEHSFGKKKGFKQSNYKHTGRRTGRSWFKTNILGKRSHFSAVGVISGEPNITLQELAIPHFVAEKLKVSERITRHNMGEFKPCRDNDKFFISRNGEKWCFVSRQSWSDLCIGDVVERPLKDGDRVFANRLPSIHKHSFIGFRAKIQQRCTIGINPIICGPISGDFDGDTIHVYVPQSLEARAEVAEMLEVSQQMICPQGGQALLRLSEDGILSSYLILKRKFWLSKNEIQMLSMHCESIVPRPAVVKGPEGRGPLWTGLQMLSMALPPHIEYCYPNRTLVVDSEVLECSVDNRWLSDCSNGIATAVCHQAGPTEAVGFLNRLQNVLHEWLLQEGFSVGLKDMYLTIDLKSRRKLLTEVQIALEYAKDSSRLAIEAEKNIVEGEKILKKAGSGISDGVHGSAIPTNTVWSTGSKSFDKLAIREFLAVFRDIQTMVEGHSSPLNPMLSMIKAGSKGSFSNLVSQCACLGLQLLHGERWFRSKELMNETFWQYRGIVKSSFLDGLVSEEFLCHLISTRKKGKGYGADEPGDLFRKCMFSMRELYLAYDRSVRTRTDNNVIQFFYENENNTTDNRSKVMNVPIIGMEIEAVGALAVTAIIEPAYTCTFDQSSSTKSHPMSLLKETLKGGLSSALKMPDYKSILTISPEIVRRKSDWARVALEIQAHLRPFMLKLLPLKTMIEYNFQKGDPNLLFPWIIHVHLPQAALQGADITVANILSVFSQLIKKGKIINSQCSLNEENETCIKICFDIMDDIDGGEQRSLIDSTLAEQLNLIKRSVLPLLLNTVIKGSPKIKSAVVQWREFEQWWWPSLDNLVQSSPEKQQPGELAVEVQTLNVSRRGQAWEIVKESCCNFMDSINWKRSRPFSIAEVCFSLGIEAARALINERLHQCVHELGKKVLKRHICLISDYMTHTGKLLPFTGNGLKQWNRLLNVSAPFTEGAFEAPRHTYFDAARRRKTEVLSGLLTSLVWGKCDNVGENKFFDIVWSPRSEDSIKKETRLNAQGKDIFEFLSEVAQLQTNRESSNRERPFEGIKHESPMQVGEDIADMLLDLPPGFGSEKNCYTEDSIDGMAENKSKEETGEEAKARTPNSETLAQLAFSIQNILHRRYRDGERLSEMDMDFMIRKVLVHHPNSKEKIGNGIAAIKIGHSVDHLESRCFVVCRTDGTCVDFSYRKCLLNIASG